MRLAYASFIDSHMVNCSTVKGISRAIVIPAPRYISRITCPYPRFAMPVGSGCRSARISLSARRLDPPKRPACARCLTTSVGTRTAHAAISPIEEASECVMTMWERVAAVSEPAGGRRERLTPS
ncbi:hypothetical protein leprecan [Aspergillus fumigatus]|nr:hypothetical protein leprecan [Aspergillus fumigatus]